MIQRLKNIAVGKEGSSAPGLRDKNSYFYASIRGQKIACGSRLGEIGQGSLHFSKP